MFKKLGREAKRLEQNVRHEAKAAEQDLRHGSQEIYQPEIAEQRADAQRKIDQATAAVASIAQTLTERTSAVNMLAPTLSTLRLQPIQALIQELTQLQITINAQRDIVVAESTRILTTDNVMNDKNKAELGRDAMAKSSPAINAIQQALNRAQELNPIIEQAMRDATQQEVQARQAADQAQQAASQAQQDQIRALQEQLARLNAAPVANAPGGETATVNPAPVLVAANRTAEEAANNNAGNNADPAHEEQTPQHVVLKLSQPK